MTDFFQSEEFADFQEKIPYRGKAFLNVKGMPPCLAVKQRIRMRKCYFWIPYGPVFEKNPDDETAAKSLAEFLENLEKLARKEGAIFSRIEPPQDLSKYFASKELKKWNLKKAPKSFGQEYTLMLDLSKSEETLMAEMHEKGRYNIRLAEKHGITVQRFDDLNMMGARYAASEFYKLLGKTAEDRFRPHPQTYYENLLSFFGPRKMASLFAAQHEGKIIGGIMVIWYGSNATYYYGASSYEHRHLMAPYLLQWSAILEAKKRGFRYYDFFGIAPGGAPPLSETLPAEKHPLAGVTEFKKKFGGFEVRYGAAYDLVHKPLWYRLYRWHTA